MNFRIHLNRLLAVTAVLTVITSARAAEIRQADAIETVVSSIRETRGGDSWDSRCDIGFRFTGDLLLDYNSALGVRTVRAIDDNGLDMCPTNQNSSGWSSGGVIGFAPLRGSHRERAGRTFNGAVKLQAASRAAKTIKVYEGELELYLPSFGNGGVVKVPDFRAHPGTALTREDFEKHGITLIYHTRESFEEARKQTPREQPEGLVYGLRLEQDERNLFLGALGVPQNTPRNVIVLQISDPGQKLVGFGFVGSDGRMLPVGSQRSVNDLRVFTFSLPVLPEELALYVYIATPGAVKVIPFKVENIPLP